MSIETQMSSYLREKLEKLTMHFWAFLEQKKKKKKKKKFYFFIKSKFFFFLPEITSKKQNKILSSLRQFHIGSKCIRKTL
jgi:hypothetical protein